MRSVWISRLGALVVFAAGAVGAADDGAAITPNAPQAVVRILVQSSPLAGSQYYRLAELRDRIKVGDRLDLVREPANPHDRNAVRVLWRGEPLGYLPRRENRAVARAMDQGETVHGGVERLIDHPDPWQRLRISVFVAL